MELYDIITQAIGIVAMIFIVLSFQSKEQKNIYIMQSFGAALFTIHYFMLGAITGGLLNILATIRNVLFIFKDKFKVDRLPWILTFVSGYVIMYILNFTVFGKDLTLLNILIELLPVIGMTALNIGFALEKAAHTRRCGLVASPSWLIYNFLAGSVGATICEILSLGSIFIGIIRHDKKK